MENLRVSILSDHYDYTYLCVPIKISNALTLNSGLTMIIARIFKVVENTSQALNSSFVGPIADGALDTDRRPRSGSLSGSLLRFVGIADDCTR